MKKQVLCIFGLFITLLSVHQCIGKLVKLENEKDINNVLNALQKFCDGKNDDFCSEENLRLTKTILDEKHIEIEKENKKIKKKDSKSYLKKKQEFERQMAVQNFRQHFLDRYF